MEAFIKEQIFPVIKYTPYHIIASCFKKLSSEEAEEGRRKAGGFIKGICHPSDNYEQIKGAGIGWNRADIPFPFDAQGSIRQNYLDWKERMRGYRENGIKLMVVTPYPKEYINAGIDPRLPENEDRVREIAVFMINDLKDLIGAVQVTNEMGIPRFTKPMTMKQAARFIGITLAAMHPHRGNILLGYNSAGPQSDLHLLMRPWLRYCDYVGIDVYIGCFAPVGNSLWVMDAMLRYVWSMTGKPVILTEFGYISVGAPKTPEEKREILQRYGVSSEAEARADIEAFVGRFNPTMQNYVKKCASGDWGDHVFGIEFQNHLYSELPKHVVIKKYPHTSVGQAEFYRDLFPRIAKLPFLLGAFIYCWKDSEKCYVCGQGDCPTETRWGLVDLNHKEKPSYYAVKDALGGIK